MSRNRSRLDGAFIATDTRLVKLTGKLLNLRIAWRLGAALRELRMLDRTTHRTGRALLERIGKHARTVSVIEALGLEQIRTRMRKRIFRMGKLVMTHAQLVFEYKLTLAQRL